MAGGRYVVHARCPIWAHVGRPLCGHPHRASLLFAAAGEEVTCRACQLRAAQRARWAGRKGDGSISARGEASLRAEEAPEP